MPPEFWEGLPTALVWIVGVIVVGGIMLQRLAEASAAFAKFVPLGQWFHKRAEQRKTEEQRRDQGRIDRAVQSALEKLTPVAFRDLERQIKRQDGEIKGLYKRLATMEAADDLTKAYLVEDAEWHARVEIEFAEQGLSGYTLPPRRSYTEFARKYREEIGWHPE